MALLLWLDWVHCWVCGIPVSRTPVGPCLTLLSGQGPPPLPDLPTGGGSARSRGAGGERSCPHAPARRLLCHHQSPPPACSEAFLKTALALQGELLIALGPDGPQEVGSVGRMIDTSQYFIDLHTVAGLITLTWPAAQDLALSDEHARILERDAQLREDLRGRLHAARGKLHYLHVLTGPAPDSRAYVATTGIAHQILKDTDLQALDMLAPIHAHLQKVQGPVKAEGDRMRNSPRNSPPLRFLLTHRTPITIEGIRQ